MSKQVQAKKARLSSVQLETQDTTYRVCFLFAIRVNIKFKTENPKSIKENLHKLAVSIYF